MADHIMYIEVKFRGDLGRTKFDIRENGKYTELHRTGYTKVGVLDNIDDASIISTMKNWSKKEIKEIKYNTKK